MPSAPLDLEGLRKLCGEATAPPWEARPDVTDDEGQREARVWTDMDPRGWRNDIGPMSEADAAFIAAARTAVPALLDEVERLRRLVARLREKIDAWKASESKQRARADRAGRLVERLCEEIKAADATIARAQPRLRLAESVMKLDWTGRWLPNEVVAALDAVHTSEAERDERGGGA